MDEECYRFLVLSDVVAMKDVHLTSGDIFLVDKELFYQLTDAEYDNLMREREYRMGDH